MEAEHLRPDRFVITVGGGSGDQTVPFDAAVQQSADDDAARLAMFPASLINVTNTARNALTFVGMLSG